MKRVLVLMGVAALAGGALGACSDDEEFDQAAYCKIALELAEQEAPTDEQLDEYVAAAPDEIKDDAAFVAGKFKDADGNIGAIFSDPEVQERFERIEAAERLHDCGTQGDDEGGDDGEEEGAGDPEPAEGATVVEVTGVEYAFQGVPETAAAGPTAFQFTNGGQEIHEMVLMRLVEGKTAADVLTLEGEDDPNSAAIIEEEVGALFAEPGGEPGGFLNTDLSAGNYALFCFVPGEGGEPHAAQGMSAEFAVA